MKISVASKARWDTRKTGSAAMECALVAAGMLRWGIALVEAAGGTVCQKREGKWEPVRAFSPEVPFGGGEPDLCFWRHPIVVGAPEAVERMCAS